MSADDIDATRYPRLARYVAGLPQGLSSYPECRAKGSLIVSALEAHDVEGLGEGLPAAMVQVLRKPPPSGLWAPAPMSDAVFYLIVDAFYPDDEAVMQWTRERTLRTANSRLYRAVSRVASPGTLLRMAAAIHRLFQRGTDLEVEYSRESATLRLTHPPYLHGGLNHRVNCPMFECILVHSGARDVAVTMSESTPTLAVYDARWSV